MAITDTSNLRPVCRIPAGSDSRSCPPDTAGFSDGRLTFADFIATPTGREVWLDALAARYDAEDRGAGVNEALRAYHAVLDVPLNIFIDDFSDDDSVVTRTDTMADCKCDDDSFDVDTWDVNAPSKRVDSAPRMSPAMKKLVARADAHVAGGKLKSKHLDDMLRVIREVDEKDLSDRSSWYVAGWLQTAAREGRLDDNPLAVGARPPLPTKPKIVDPDDHDQREQRAMKSPDGDINLRQPASKPQSGDGSYQAAHESPDEGNDIDDPDLRTRMSNMQRVSQAAADAALATPSLAASRRRGRADAARSVEPTHADGHDDTSEDAAKARMRAASEQAHKAPSRRNGRP